MNINKIKYDWADVLSTVQYVFISDHNRRKKQNWTKKDPHLYQK